MPACPDRTVGRMPNAEIVDAILDGQGNGRYPPARWPVPG